MTYREKMSARNDLARRAAAYDYTVARRVAHAAFCARWLTGMDVRASRTESIRKQFGWSAEQYPTDREQLAGCTITTA
jgi:hypothetical protein